MQAKQTYRGRRIPVNSRMAFDALYNRNCLRDAYKALVAALPTKREAIREAMAAGKGKSNVRVAILLENAAYDHFDSTAAAAAWVREYKIKSFQNPCNDMF